MAITETPYESNGKVTFLLDIEKDISTFKKHNNYLDVVDNSDDSRIEIIDKNNKIKSVKKRNTNDEKFEDTIMYQFQLNVFNKNHEFENFSLDTIKREIDINLNDEEKKILTIIGCDTNTKLRARKISVFYKDKFEEYFLKRYPKFILHADFVEFCKSTNIKAFSKVDRMLSAIDKFEDSLSRKCLIDELSITDEKIPIDENQQLYFKNEKEDKLYKAIVDTKTIGYEKDKQFIPSKIQDLYYIDTNGLEFKIIKEKDSLFYIKPKIEMQKKTGKISLIKGIDYSFKPTANDLIDEIDLDYDLDEFKKSFLKKKNIKNKYSYFDKIIIELDPLKLYFSLALGKNFSYLIKPFRENFNSSYTFRLDEIIRRKLYHTKKANLKFIDLGNYDALKILMECKNMDTKHFKNERLKVSIEEFNNATKDVKIIRLEEVKSGSKIDNVRLHIEQKDTETIVDYIFVKVKTILFLSKAEIKSTKGFKNQIKFKLWNDDEQFYSKKMIDWRNLAEKELKYVDLLKQCTNFIQELNSDIPDIKTISYDEKNYRIKENGEIIKGINDIFKSLEYMKEHFLSKLYTLYDFKDAIKYKNAEIIDFKELEFQMLQSLKNGKLEHFSLKGDNEELYLTFIKVAKEGLLHKVADIVKKIDSALKELE